MGAQGEKDKAAGVTPIVKGRIAKRAICLLFSSVCALAICFHFLGPSKTDNAHSAPPWFQDVSAEVGVQFLHETGPPDGYFLPYIMGSGAALIDFDQDGLLDLYL